MTRQSQKAASALCYPLLSRILAKDLRRFVKLSSLLRIHNVLALKRFASRCLGTVFTLWNCLGCLYLHLFHPFSSVFIVFMLCSVASLWAPPRFLQTLYPDWCGPGNRNRSVNLQSKPELGSKRSSFVTACYAWKSQKMPEATLRFPMVIACIGEASYWTGTLGDAKRGECRIDSKYFNIFQYQSDSCSDPLCRHLNSAPGGHKFKAAGPLRKHIPQWMKWIQDSSNTAQVNFCLKKVSQYSQCCHDICWQAFKIFQIHNPMVLTCFDIDESVPIGWEVEWSGGVKLLGLLAELHGDAASNSEAARPGRQVFSRALDKTALQANLNGFRRFLFLISFSFFFILFPNPPEPWCHG